MRLGPVRAPWSPLLLIFAVASARAATEVRLGGCVLAVGDGSGELSRTGECDGEQGGLFLSSMGITAIAAGTFDRMSITVLDLSDNNISALPLLPPSLEYLSLQQNRLDRLEDQFSACINLKQLSLSRNVITSLSHGVFQNLERLQQLFLDSNQIAELPSGVFDALVALRGLDLSHNNITSLSLPLFNSLQLLDTLSLSHNKIAAVGPGANVTGWVELRNLRALQRLYLDHNSIRFLPPDLFHLCTGLRRLELQANQISSLPGQVFAKLPALQHVSLAENRIVTLPRDLFSVTTALAVLDLSDNQVTISSIADQGIFAPLTRLQEVRAIERERARKTASDRGRQRETKSE